MLSRRGFFRGALAGLAAAVAAPFLPMRAPVEIAAYPSRVAELAAARPGTLMLTRGLAVRIPPEDTLAVLDEVWLPGLVDEQYARRAFGDRLDDLIADGTFLRAAPERSEA